MDIQEFTARGIKFPTGHALTREWAGATGEGGFSFNEMPFVFDGAFRKPTVARLDAAGAPGAAQGAAKAIRRTYDIASAAKDDIQTYTMEQGDKSENTAKSMKYGHINGLTVNSERAGEMAVNFDMIGQRFKTKGGGLTANPVEVPTVYGTPEMVNVYVDDTSAGIGTTLMRNSAVSMELSDRFNQAWFHDRSLESFLEHVEQQASLGVNLTIGEGPQVEAFMDGLRAGQRKFISFDILGQPIPGSTIPFSCEWNTACQVSDPYSYSDEDGVYMAEIALAAEHDPVWGKATEIVLVSAPDSSAGGIASVDGEDDGEGSSSTSFGGFKVSNPDGMTENEPREQFGPIAEREREDADVSGKAANVGDPAETPAPDEDSDEGEDASDNSGPDASGDQTPDENSNENSNENGPESDASTGDEDEEPDE